MASRVHCVWFVEDPIGVYSQNNRIDNLGFVGVLLSQTKHVFLLQVDLSLHQLIVNQNDELITLQTIALSMIISLEIPWYN